ncbi:MAG: hypothetical protein CL778_04575 [Chloroflexi bacterium]|mgnify:CR=1 FL=1|nr:hypothetical protein [Chloroflexota bacterium]|tara:strand:+ start:100932 stop:101726 length:795 start_codon:yes stop_codon:yes gene_type:complete
MFHLYLKIIKDYWKSTTWFSIGMGLIGIYVISVYPSFEKSSDEFNKVIGNLPEAIKIVIGEGSMSSIEGFMNLEIFQLFAPIVISIYAVTKGASSIAGEEESHTLDQLLSLPISRISVILQKSFALYTGVFLVCFGLWIGIIIGGITINYPLSQINIIAASFSLFIYGISVSSLAIFFSSISGKRGLSAGLTSAIILVSYIINSLSSIVSSLEPLKFSSIFYYYNENIVIVNGLKFNHISILFCISIVFLLIGIIKFNSRDLNN